MSKSGLILLCLLALAKAQTVPIYLNAGGEAYTDNAGRGWIPDDGYVSTGDTYCRHSPIGETENDQMYTSERYFSGGDDSYEYTIPVPAAGDYVIKLHFAEIYFSSTNQRVFDIYVEDSLIAGSFDIVEQAGGENTAVVVTDVRNISDGAVNVRLSSVTENPKISGIEVYQYVEPQSSVCENFAVHARTTITFDGVRTTIRGGDVGVSPGTAITGDPQFQDQAGAGGEILEDSAVFAASVVVAHAAAMAVRADGQALGIEIGGKTFTPGTYRSSSAINFAYGTVVTLDGLNQINPVFLFQAGSTLVTAANTYFILKNGAKAENVLWALGTAATLGADSVLEGSILAGTAITFGTKSELHGCALAQSAVTFESEGSVYVVDNAPGTGSTRHLRGSQ